MVNGKLIYSKLAKGAFPDGESIRAAIDEFVRTGKVVDVKPAQGGCIIA